MLLICYFQVPRPGDNFAAVYQLQKWGEATEFNKCWQEEEGEEEEEEEEEVAGEEEVGWAMNGSRF